MKFGPMSYENFHKYNFCNDHVVTKIMKIFYYKNLELYSTYTGLVLG